MSAEKHYAMTAPRSLLDEMLERRLEHMTVETHGQEGARHLLAQVGLSLGNDVDVDLRSALRHLDAERVIKAAADEGEEVSYLEALRRLERREA
jgi:hypothetical protein